MTQHPADPLVEKVARALYSDSFSDEWSDAQKQFYEKKAQAALAAVRGSHVLIPKAELSGMLKRAMDEVNQRVEQIKRDSMIDPVRLLDRYMTQHDGAKDA